MATPSSAADSPTPSNDRPNSSESRESSELAPASPPTLSPEAALQSQQLPGMAQEQQLSVPLPPSAPRPAASPKTPVTPWDYSAPHGFFDEVHDAAGAPRPHWQPLLQALDALGPDDFAKRWEEGLRVLQSNGVTYNVYGDPNGMERPWALDPIPLMISAADWRTIEQAVQQRATLLNLILADLLGPQTLIHERLLPPELVFAHSGFLRPCHGHANAPSVYLNLYAAEVVRSPEGQWWIMGDRTQSPSGAGYALENRVVLSRMMPDVLHDCSVRGLGTYVQDLREMLVNLARTNRDNPRIVLWTPGPYNETYFEHAYLARHLGITLVEGGDLTVRDNVVYLKTLSGLLPVDVILRRLDDSFCDPLELRGDSTLGIPGLVQAIRSGQVMVANALGTGLLDTPAIMAFLPILCRRLLGEELKIPSVATWWCGHQQPLQYVLDHLDTLVIKPAFSNTRNQSLFPARMSAAEKAALRAKIQAHPHQWVAQETVKLATSPIWEQSHFDARHWMLRVHAVSNPNGYRVMAGGLTRFSAMPQTQEVSMQRGGGSKDTWVLGDAPVMPPMRPRRAAPTRPIDINRSSFDLPSRVADNLYWLGRYIERVESDVRILRVALNRFAEQWTDTPTSSLNVVLQMLMRLNIVPDDLLARPHEDNRDRIQQELLSVILDPNRPGNLQDTVNRVFRIAWLVRDRISKDAWNVLNQLDQAFAQPELLESLEVSSAMELLDQAIVNLMAFSGLVAESMTRSQGWRFLDIGRRIEWAMQKTERLYVSLVDATDQELDQLQLLLELGDSSMTYRARYLTLLQTDLVLDLLLIDEANPRSIGFQLARLHEHIENLPYRPGDARRSPESRLALDSLTKIRLADVDELIWTDASGHRPHLNRLLARLRANLPNLSDALTASYLSYAVPIRSLTATSPEPVP
ncbi:circularly permuted type 2 ATP-grasp protein [Tuwongella immobilis]|uniref:Uncharacterized protein n=1 Tax=Tuwongella immobilis TaxID=692036 RepID=A0A6C2YQT4_9BACT|nr:circularly permuted type 2 ATP-grasp protein [Tuwongella immobilis]VIP03519.1 Uncharacterized protein OS=Caenispirillum salinarum AK4 GN=C882_4545 PE=4 SV=1: CP_ATPgrasp_1: Alpha-E [Tuwongella immobilis]VTS04406.1 Uncharacterized protein OS=Caenispirillum salinarum AK4 GN=C882_4545 PE=4 SV=1: CP_ATPgrasp_1: Alpha-E [Tuwongella immobilis]